jgi:hypothetical protein
VIRKHYVVVLQSPRYLYNTPHPFTLSHEYKILSPYCFSRSSSPHHRPAPTPLSPSSKSLLHTGLLSITINTNYHVNQPTLLPQASKMPMNLRPYHVDYPPYYHPRGRPGFTPYSAFSAQRGHQLRPFNPQPAHVRENVTLPGTRDSSLVLPGPWSWGGRPQPRRRFYGPGY